MLWGNIRSFGLIREYCNKFNIADGVEKNDSQNEIFFESVENIPRLPKILIIDIETSPHVSFHFGVRKQFISPKQIIQQQVILTVSLKWLGEDTHTILRLDDYENAITHNSGKYVSTQLNDHRLLVDLWDYLDQADVIVAHNGLRFDNGWIRQQMIKHGLSLPSPYKVVDTLKVIRKELSLPQNTLEAAANFFDLAIKKRDISFDAWIGCMYGSEEAFDEMSAYNVDDIYVLEALYLLIRSIDSTHPNVALLTNQVGACTHCGSNHKKLVNTRYYTSASAFVMYNCLNCGGYFRGRNSDKNQKVDSRNL